MTIWDKYEKDAGQEYHCTILYGKEAKDFLFDNGSITRDKAEELKGWIKTYYFPFAEAKEAFEIGVKVGDVNKETCIIGSTEELSVLYEKDKDKE